LEICQIPDSVLLAKEEEWVTISSLGKLIKWQIFFIEGMFLSFPHIDGNVNNKFNIVKGTGYTSRK
jgi:hypothetical protein